MLSHQKMNHSIFISKGSPMLKSSLFGTCHYILWMEAPYAGEGLCPLAWMPTFPTRRLFLFFFFFRMALNTQCHAQSQFVWSMHLFLQVLTAFDLPVPLSVVKVSGHPHERLPTSQRAEAKSEAPWPHSSLSVGPRDMVPVWSACVYTDGGLSAVEN